MRIDLHRHLGGCCHPQTICDILTHQKYECSLEEITKRMTFAPGEKLTFHNFLSKFDILNTIIWDEWSVVHLLKQVCYDIAKERLDYVELKIGIDKYVQHSNWSDSEVIDLIYSVITEECAKWEIHIGLVLSLKYESDRHRQREIARLIDSDVASKLIGIDLVGEERYYDADFYAPIFKEWKEAGKGLEAHVGESQSAENVRSAIEVLGVDRIAHGIKAADYPDILKLANERKICFDIATTSNFYTGVVDRKHPHPVRKLLEQGCNVTIGTDDPVVLVTDLDREYTFLQKHLELSDDRLMDIMENSYKYAFTNLDDLRIKINETQQAH